MRDRTRGPVWWVLPAAIFLGVGCDGGAPGGDAGDADGTAETDADADADTRSDADAGWYINFAQGYSLSDDKSEAGYVLCVRHGP